MLFQVTNLLFPEIPDLNKNDFALFTIAGTEVKFHNIYISLISTLIQLPCGIILKYIFNNRKIKDAPHISG